MDPISHGREGNLLGSGWVILFNHFSVLVFLFNHLFKFYICNKKNTF